MTTYEIGDPVWAKMKFYPKWPGVVAEPPEDQKMKKKGNKHCIYFVDTNNYAWIGPKNLEPYDEDAEVEKIIADTRVTVEGGPALGETSESFDQLMRPSTSNCDSIPTDKKKSITRKRKIPKDGREGGSTNVDSLEDVPRLATKSLKVEGPEKSLDAPKGPTLRKFRKSLTRTCKIPKAGREVGNSNVDSLEDEPRLATKSLKVEGPKKSLDEPKGLTPQKLGDGSLGKRRKKTIKFVADSNDGESSSNRESLLDRPTLIPRAETPQLDLLTPSNTLLRKFVTPTDKRIGFIGLGIMGRGIVKNLLHFNHKVFVWDRNPEKSQEFARIGAEVQKTPSDVVRMADMTFSCVTDPSAVKELTFGDCEVLSVMNHTKAFIEMSGIDPDTSQTIACAISEFGGKYLEAALIGSKAEADEGTLTILAAGDLSVFKDLRSCFEAMGRASIFLGEVGRATKMNLVTKMFEGTVLAALAGSMSLADRAGLNMDKVLEVINHSKVWCPLVADRGKAIADGEFEPQFPLWQVRKDLQLVQGFSESLDQPVPITTAASEAYKLATRFGYGDHDAAAVYKVFNRATFTDES